MCQTHTHTTCLSAWLPDEGPDKKSCCPNELKIRHTQTDWAQGWGSTFAGLILLTLWMPAGWLMVGCELVIVWVSHKDHGIFAVVCFTNIASTMSASLTFTQKVAKRWSKVNLYASDWHCSKKKEVSLVGLTLNYAKSVSKGSTMTRQNGKWNVYWEIEKCLIVLK